MSNPKYCRAFLACDGGCYEGGCGFSCDLLFGHGGDHVATRSDGYSDHPLKAGQRIIAAAEIRWRYVASLVTA